MSFTELNLVPTGCCSMDPVLPETKIAGNLKDFLRSLHRELYCATTGVFSHPNIRSYCYKVLDGWSQSARYDTDPEKAQQMCTMAGEGLLILLSQFSQTAEIARLLIAHGVSPNCTMLRIYSEDFEGGTPLTMATLYKQVAICRVLVVAGADVEKPCQFACTRGLSENINGCTPLMVAACTGEVEIVR